MAIQSTISHHGTLSFPKSFVLPNLLAPYQSVFEIKKSPFQEHVGKVCHEWFAGFDHFDDFKTSHYLSPGQLDLLVALAFPNADIGRLETCLRFLLWAFSADDTTDEGEFQSQPESVQMDVDRSGAVIDNLDSPRPACPYATMLHDILTDIRATASPKVYSRFCVGWRTWTNGQVQQSSNRFQDAFPSLEDFIVMRRGTIGGGMVEAMIQYALDLDIPDEVFAHPLMKGISDAAIDLMAWPNDLCSFNKEQADGDLQNLVPIIMAKRNVDLQSAVDILTTMITERFNDYVEMKSQLPQFGSSVDAQLALYLKNLEHFIQGTVRWYYSSPRYFPPAGLTTVCDMEINLLDV